MRRLPHIIFSVAMAALMGAAPMRAQLAATPSPTAVAPTLPAASPGLPATPPQELMPLSDVKPGMKGEWRSVVEGTAIKTFQLEVLGVMENFSGPKRSIIICQALDADEIHDGPVAGMSGSPVYIEGKLVGAYAYGFSNSKDQALIGVTPISDMMEVLSAPAAVPMPGRLGPPRAFPAKVTSDAPSDQEQSDSPMTSTAGIGDAGGWRVTQGQDRLAGRDVASLLRPLPTPLIISGVSARTLSVFKDEFARRGMDVVQAPGGTASDGGPGPNTLEAGSPMAVVLLSGDFSISGVGTLTWRQGDKLLAFGHPMFNFGAVNLPLATAEIVTVVRAYDQSFKLANTGPVVGTISQDRLTGISGTIGAKPELTDFRSHVTASDGTTRTFQGELWQNREMSPVIGATGLLESLNATSQVAQEQTFYVNTTVDIDGFAPLEFKTVASGPDAADSVAEDFLRQYDELLGNEFEFPKVKSVDFDVKLRDAWLMSKLESVRVESGPVRAGDMLRVVLTLSNYLAAPTEQVVEVPIPAQAAGETLTLFFGDASAADALDRGSSRRDLSSLADVVNYLRQSHSGGALYVKLLRSVPGLRVEGESLPSLPPSVQALYLSPKNVSTASGLTQTTLWETSISVPGEFSGRYNLSVPVLP